MNWAILNLRNLKLPSSTIRVINWCTLETSIESWIASYDILLLTYKHLALFNLYIFIIRKIQWRLAIYLKYSTTVYNSTVCYSLFKDLGVSRNNLYSIDTTWIISNKRRCWSTWFYLYIIGTLRFYCHCMNYWYIISLSCRTALIAECLSISFWYWSININLPRRRTSDWYSSVNWWN